MSYRLRTYILKLNDEDLCLILLELLHTKMASNITNIPYVYILTVHTRANDSSNNDLCIRNYSNLNYKVIILRVSNKISKNLMFKYIYDHGYTFDIKEGKFYYYYKSPTKNKPFGINKLIDLINTDSQQMRYMVV